MKKRITLLLGFLFCSLAGFALAEEPGAQSSVVSPAQTEAPAPAVASGPLYRSKLVSMDVWAGFTTLDMTQVNHFITDRRNYMRSVGYDENMTLNKMNYGANLGVDLNFQIVRGLRVGPRLGFLYIIPGEASGRNTWMSYYYGRIESTWKETFTGYVVPIGLGISYSPPMKSRVNFTFGLNTGMALLYTDENSTFTSNDPYLTSSTYRYNIQTAGSGIYANFIAAMNIMFTRGFGMYARLGYRFCNITNMVITKGVNTSPYGRIEVGDTVEDMHGDTMNVDISGADVGLGLLFDF